MRVSKFSVLTTADQNMTSADDLNRAPSISVILNFR